MTDTPLAVKEPSRLPDQLLRYPGFVTLVSLNHGPSAQDTGDLDAPERSRKALALSENARVHGDITGQVGRGVSAASGIRQRSRDVPPAGKRGPRTAHGESSRTDPTPRTEHSAPPRDSAATRPARRGVLPLGGEHFCLKGPVRPERSCDQADLCAAGCLIAQGQGPAPDFSRDSDSSRSTACASAHGASLSDPRPQVARTQALGPDRP